MTTRRLAALAAALLALPPLGCQSDRLAPPPPPPPEVPAPWPPDVPAIGRPIGAGAEPALVLGQGFDSVALHPREACLDPGEIIAAPLGYGALGPVYAWEALARLELADGFPTLALLDGSPNAAAGRLLVDDGFAVDRWAMFEVSFETQQFGFEQRRWTIDPAATDFAAHCGDEVVRSIVPGGQYLFGWRLETGTLADRTRLLANLDYQTTWTGSSAVAAETRRRLAAWRGRAVVRMLVLQRGGDPTLLSGAVGDGTTSPAWTLDCAVDDLGPCGAFLDRAITALAADGPGAFISTVRSMPARLAASRIDWAVVGGPDLSWRTPDEVFISRLKLSQELKVQAAVQSRLSMLESGKLDLAPAVAALLPAWRTTADANLALVADALRDCQERLTDWTDAAQVARCAAGGTHAALVARGLDEALTAPAMEAVPATP